MGIVCWHIVLQLNNHKTVRDQLEAHANVKSAAYSSEKYKINYKS